jgi:predicted transcriptional regulator of viral defense system
MQEPQLLLDLSVSYGYNSPMISHESQVPVEESESPGPDWTALRLVAAGQAGFFTAAQAAETGFSKQLLSMHTAKGKFQRPLRGIYRFADFSRIERPLTPVERAQDDLVVAWLWSGSCGVVSHESALLLHDLSDAFPSRIHLTLPTEDASRRREVPPSFILHFADLTAGDQVWMGPIPVTTPARTVLDVAARHGDADLVQQAIDQGMRRGAFRLWDVVPAIEYARSFDTPGWRVFPEAVADLGDAWFMHAFSGNRPAAPPTDWPTLAREVVERHGGRLYGQAHHCATGTLSVHVVWPIDQGPSATTVEALRQELRAVLGWR